MRRSFPLMTKYPPNSSGSSWCRTSSPEDIPRRLHRADYRAHGIISEERTFASTYTRPTRTMMGSRPQSLISTSTGPSLTCQHIFTIIRPRYEVKRSRAWVGQLAINMLRLGIYELLHALTSDGYTLLSLACVSRSETIGLETVTCSYHTWGLLNSMNL